MAVSRPLFLYGTLRYLDLLRIVAGAELPWQNAWLHGYAVVQVAGADYPRPVEAEGTCAGILVEDPEVRARLDYFEGGFGYGLRRVTVETSTGPVDAEIYWPHDGIVASDQAFDLAEWIETWGRMALHFASEAMEGFGAISPEVLASRFAQIRARAWSRVLAEQEAPVRQLPGRPAGPAEIETFRRPYSNFFSVMEHDLTFPRFDGSKSPVVNRAALVAADAVVVLPYDPVRDRVLLIEQFRPAMMFRGDPDAFSVEAVAGRIDPGESADQAARREAVEEAGLQLQTLHRVSTHYPSPGAFTEYLTLFVGIADLPDGIEGIGGVETEDENIRSHLFDYATFEDWLDQDQFRNAPLILLGHWLARHRDALRDASAQG
ncbi:NUDIX domain-containing protein [Shimia ponticola]|uniref:NUDIX domain-containing protein n=1 Tax=Shimia ponticola TaxID=2582893 RepID=UPI0011BF8260|nr:NUDIX domain-containing protein [Shimia ponticola]